MHDPPTVNIGLRALFFFLVAGVFVFYVSGMHKLFKRSVDKKLKKFHESNPKLIESGVALLKNLFFFQSLDENGKKLLLANASELLARTTIVDQNNKPLDLERSYQICLVLSLVTLGLEEGNYLKGLRKIQLFPGAFYSKLAGAEVKGLSHVRGRLWLSYPDFVAGFDTNEDRINLGLHEAAHILVICGYVQINGNDDWTFKSQTLMNQVKEYGNTSAIFREYAFTNIMEFWACCVEQFYELPQLFMEQHPAIYTATKRKLGF